ncbi:MAG: 3D domain-containing protein [Pyrinomonadaceae bacterium]
MKPVISGSAIIASSILLGSLFFSAKPSIAETSLEKFQTPKAQGQDAKALVAANATESAASSSEAPTDIIKDEDQFVAPPTAYVATAYSLRGRTASGKYVSKGIIAADPRVLPLGSRVRLHAGGYSGEYLVADTGGKIRGRRIDIWTASSREAMRFGRRTIKLTVLSYGGKRTTKSSKMRRTAL